MKYTEEQISFIEERGKNILVSAAAGSGKTAVITERVIRLILEGADVSKLLIVTFTKAAASEMRDRIREALSEKLLSSELTEGQREHLSKQMTLIFSADITTIDSFCLNLAREHFNVCRVDPSFRVADEGELKLIAEEVMDKLLEEKYESGDEEFYSFVDNVSRGRDDGAVADAIRSVYKFAVSRPDPCGYISSMASEYDISSADELKDKGFMTELMELSHERVRLAISIIEHGLRLCDDPGGPYYYADALEDDRDIAERLLNADSYSLMQDELKGADFMRLPSKRDESVDPEVKERVKGLRNRVKKIISEELKGDLFSKSVDDILYEMKLCLPEVKVLAGLSALYMERYGKERRERGVMDFSDLEHAALMILRDEETRKALQERYTELIIDEYQDCNRIQEEIFSAISNGHNYITVGDVKQSIYSFRDACPGLFMSKFDHYGSAQSEGDGSSRLITLSKNFRSGIYVTKTVNSVFSKIMTKKCGGALYDDSQSLHYGELYEHQENFEKCSYISVACDPDKEEDPIETEAMAIAAKIKALTDPVNPTILENRKDNTLRPVSYGDIVILLRSVKSLADSFSEVFAKEGIPLVFDSSGGYLLSYEIREIMNFLSVIDNPRQDIPLAGVLTGYFGGFSSSEMVYIRKEGEKEDLYESLIAASENNKREALRDKCRAFLNKLEGYRKKSAYTPIQELISLIISEHHYDRFVRAMSDGERREGNIRLLKKRAADYEKTSFHGLFKFLRYIDNMKKYEMDFGEASGTEAVDAVRIMSIHHSKGLEFPVVFVSTLRRGFNTTDTRENMLFDDELGVGTDLVIRDRNLMIKTLIKKVISRKKRLSLISEEMRVLYVAMTRAENLLFLTSIKEDGGSVKTEPAEASCPADFIETAWEEGSEDTELITLPFSKKEETSGEEASGEGDTPVKKVLELTKFVKEQDVEAVLKELDYVYPYESSLHVPQKVSVSFIKHEAMEEKGVSIASDPRGDRVVPTAGALRGTAVHTAFENLPLGREYDEAAASLYLDSLLAAKRISEEERGYIRTSDIIDFSRADIARRMGEAEARHELFREQPFIISVPAKEIDKSYPEYERIMVQGIIDAFFVEGDRVVVVDYKTDSVKEAGVLIDRYQAQLDYYERALLQLTEARESEKIIYSVSLGVEIRLG